MSNLQEVNLTDVAPKIVTQLGQGGAFLTVAQNDKVNTMTVGWATLGRMWNKPICVVPVRF
ncbi:MAG TPA: flavin reductase family protein, partial [Firmicutes bacterium]|nr:flavin reductase family protein [Bacillota bacterium]